MNQDLTVSEKNPLMTLSDKMHEMGISAGDIEIPLLMLMANTSAYVGDGKAKLGDVVNSQTFEVLGGFDKPVEIIPLRLFKTLRTYDTSVKGTPKFIRSEPVTPKNEKLPWEDVEDGHPIKRVTCFNFFCLLPSDVAKEEAFPVVIRFKSTSMQAGRQLASHMFKREVLGKNPYSQAVTLTVKKEKKDTNTYGVFEMGKGRTCSPEEIKAASFWFVQVDAMRDKVDDTEDKDHDEPVYTAKVVSGNIADAKKF